ncbi:hypothetical protein KKB18_01190 [bacterium]|nr:hypothetical protein [bacterium]
MTTGERIKDCIRHLVFGMLGAALIMSPFIPKYFVMSRTFDNSGKTISEQYATKRDVMELDIKIGLLKIEDLSMVEITRKLLDFHEYALDYFDKIGKVLNTMKNDIKDLDRRMSEKI